MTTVTLDHHQNKQRGVTHLHLPAYICDTLLTAVHALGMEYSYYLVSQTLKAAPQPPKGSAVLLIHYFGWENKATGELRTGAEENYFLIEDFSHSFLNPFFRKAFDNQYRFAFFSARKILPSLMGGWSSLGRAQLEPSLTIEAATWRLLAAKLLKGNYLSSFEKRADMALEQQYLDVFKKTEEYLNEHPQGEKWPNIAQLLTSVLNWEDIRSKRWNNWKVLKEYLKDSCQMMFKDNANCNVPLGFLIAVKNRDDLRRLLAKERIFCPAYWPLPKDVDLERFPNAHEFANRSLSLPVDQRYDQHMMPEMAKVVKELI